MYATNYAWNSTGFSANSIPDISTICSKICSLVHGLENYHLENDSLGINGNASVVVDIDQLV